MTPLHRLNRRQSERRQRINELGDLETLDAEQIAELKETRAAYDAGEEQLQALEAVAATEDAAASAEATEDPARRELRSRARLGNYLQAALTGKEVAGAELELRQEGNGAGNEVPLELFGGTLEKRADAATPAPSTGRGVDVEPIRPMIFARSIAGRMGIAMPQTGTGSFATMTITAGLSAAAQGINDSAESNAATLTAQTTEAHRISARLSVRLEDIYRIGTESFEAALRQNLSLTMSAQLDGYCLTGTGASNQPEGLLPRLTDPTNPTTVVDWAGFVAAVAAGIDGGPWAEDMTAVKLLVNAETMRLAEQTFREPTGTEAQGYATPGEMSAAAYLRAHSGGFFASARMPDTAANIAQAVRHRSGTMGLDGVNAGRTAVMPTWAMLAIDDIYTDSASGRKHVTLHALVGDVIIEQANAYERVDLKVS